MERTNITQPAHTGAERAVGEVEEIVKVRKVGRRSELMYCDRMCSTASQKDLGHKMGQ